MQLSLFPDLVPPAKLVKRHTYTMAEVRTVKADYTEGWLKGPQMARKLGVPYPAFKAFVKRNPQLKKGYHTKPDSK
ncbi:hypothetical protein [Pontibacter mangrovi]|uniref:Uncharacterized protein n=1 Tax=Pontibacter mangrovi TaxID=2589816 RepID=A0A501W6M9_9BACT|nr:hypothetical protein [Pontibacter mangrovi]TPE44948.1 hypothetical protein FJM65_08000 [Pontibacter mangrovi]